MPKSLAERQEQHIGEITAGLRNLYSVGLFTEKNKFLITNYPENAMVTAAILWNLNHSDKNLVNDNNRQQLMTLLNEAPHEIPNILSKCESLLGEGKLTQEQFDAVIGSKKLKKEAFLTGLHPRLGSESSINRFFGSHSGNENARISNDELSEPKLIREIFKFL